MPEMYSVTGIHTQRQNSFHTTSAHSHAINAQKCAVNWLEEWYLHTHIIRSTIIQKVTITPYLTHQLCISQWLWQPYYKQSLHTCFALPFANSGHTEMWYSLMEISQFDFQHRVVCGMLHVSVELECIYSLCLSELCWLPNSWLVVTNLLRPF